MTNKKTIQALTACIACALIAAVQAQDSIKVGVLAPFSGPFADFGKQISNGIKVYMKQHGDTVAGRKIEVVYKDTTGPAPDVAKRLAQELVTREHVQFIAGFGLTPNAMAVAPVATEAKVPTVIMNAATSIITTKSPYLVRVSMTLPQVTAPMAEWAYKTGIRNVYTLVTDYGPGHDAEATFKKVFTKLGGRIVGEARVPLRNPEYAPYVQRVKDTNPEALFVFIPAGEAAVGIMKAYGERGLARTGIKLIGTGDMTDDTVLAALGNTALGMVTTHHYSAAHDSAENTTYVKTYAELHGTDLRPNFMSVGGYDGMAAIYEVARQLNGDIDGDKAMAVLQGMKLNSPRGPIMIDPQTRDVTQNIYVRKVERVDGQLYNVEFDKFEMVKDPGKE